MLGIRFKELKVFRCIIEFVSVYVMNHFAFNKIASKLSFYDQSMLSNVPINVRARVVRGKYKCIAVLYYVLFSFERTAAQFRAEPIRSRSSSADFNGFITTGTKASGGLYPTLNIAEVALPDS